MSDHDRFEIDYRAAIVHCFKKLGHAQGTSGCIAFARGAEWMRDVIAARSGQAASGSSQGARSDVPNGVGQPEAPTAAPLEPFRTALVELVELENLRIRAGTISPVEPGCEKEVLMDEWRRRIRPAWSNARAVLATHPPARSVERNDK